jgi:dipeptidyl aminopeptidase/acylaminoacyl peptidase
VHEYGGGAYVVDDGDVWYVDFADQHVYVQRRGGRPVAITTRAHVRHADFQVDRRRTRLICVEEDHRASGEPINRLVAIPMAPAATGTAEESTVLSEGADFYAAPRLSPDGRLLAWLSWRHPDMPWDATALWVAEVADDGTLQLPRLVAGGPAESVCQPAWGRDGALYFVSDRDGWWRFYVAAPEAVRLALDSEHSVPGPQHVAPETSPSEVPRFEAPHSEAPRSEIPRSEIPRSASEARPLTPDALRSVQVAVRPVLPAPPADTEFARPQWLLGMRDWAFVGETTMAVTAIRDGRARLALVDVRAGTCTLADTEFEPLDGIVALGDEIASVAGFDAAPSAIVTFSPRTGHLTTVRRASEVRLDPAYISRAQAIAFPSDGRLARAFYYAPANGEYVGASGLPPLIVISHGGPTSAASPSLRLGIQYWTSRGFAVVDVNYAGSTGFGRSYREALNGEWGVADVADCVNAARYLVTEGRVDPARLVIRGGSAGGYTTLAALTFHAGVFKAGASYYGISDLETLAHDTHKFESRYLERLVGPYPAAADVYRARSPIHAIDRLACPLILFHGAEDKAVPPAQAETMAQALREKGLPVALLVFEGEQHGFRRAETLVRSIEAELWFYGAVFGFTPADPIAPVEVSNLPSRPGRAG